TCLRRKKRHGTMEKPGTLASFDLSLQIKVVGEPLVYWEASPFTHPFDAIDLFASGAARRTKADVARNTGEPRATPLSIAQPILAAPPHDHHLLREVLGSTAIAAEAGTEIDNPIPVLRKHVP